MKIGSVLYACDQILISEADTVDYL